MSSKAYMQAICQLEISTLVRYTFGMAMAAVGGKESKQIPRLWANGALLGVALIWGSTFVLIKDIIEQVSPLLFLAARFAVGGLALALIITFMRRWRGFSMREFWWGSLIGVALWAGYALQTIGLQDTTASNAGFITSLYVVIVPVLGLFILKQKPDRWAWLGVLAAIVGLAMLILNFEEGVRINQGDPIVLGCSVAFALHVVLVARVAPWCDILRVTMVQIIMAGLLNAVTAIIFERPVQGLSGEIWGGVVFLGLAATALAIVIQMSVQRFTTAVNTVLILSLEPVFAAIFGVWLQNDRLGPIALIGGVLILCGMLIAEIGSQLRSIILSRLRTQAATNLLIRADKPRTDIPPSDVS